MDSVKEEDSSLGLDGDVAAQLDDSLVLVVTGIQKPEKQINFNFNFKLFLFALTLNTCIWKNHIITDERIRLKSAGRRQKNCSASLGKFFQTQINPEVK